MTEPKTILALSASDEMRHPYEACVQNLGAKVEWLTSFDDLIERASALVPLAVIVDLDSVAGHWDTELNALKTAFPTSDLIAFSSNDSAQTALRCIRSGFFDFLLKPVSPEELAWSISKCLQRQELLDRLSDGKNRIVRAIAQVSNSTAPALLRHSLVENLAQMLESTGCAWIEPPAKAESPPSIICYVPKGTDPNHILSLLPQVPLFEPTSAPLVFRNQVKENQTLYLPFRDSKKGGVFAWGIQGKLGKQNLSNAKILVEHAEVCLMNLQKFEEIKQQTFVDDLTGLFNSRYLKFALNKAILRHRQKDKPFSLLFIDVDHFKNINDKNGHLVGSAFLVAISKTIRNVVRQIDSVFRYGGDEFIVILQDTPKEKAQEIAERIRRNVEKRVFLLHTGRIQATVSIGIAVYPDHTQEKETLLKLADEAMYSAKNESRNAVHTAFGLVPREGTEETKDLR